MPAYAVKHVVADLGPLSRQMKDIRRTPYSLTSKEPEASDAARGGYIYVVEVRGDTAGRSFALGYMYRADEKFTLAGGGLWKGGFKFKNSATPTLPAAGAYFDTPVVIDDPGLREWLSRKQPAMSEIPAELVPALQRLISEPTNGAKPFA